MPEFVRRPKRVTAYQFDGTEEMALKLYQWYRSCKGAAVPLINTIHDLEKAVENRQAVMSYDTDLGIVRITTPTGHIELLPEDWFVQSPSHEFYRMSDEDFKAEHDRLQEHRIPVYPPGARAITDSPQA